MSAIELAAPLGTALVVPILPSLALISMKMHFQRVLSPISASVPPPSFT